MKYYVDQLLDCLDLYQSLIRQGVFEAGFTKYVDKLNEEIDLLRSISRAPEKQLLEYDYHSLKRNLARLFHDDCFHGNSALLENNDMLFAKAMGILDDIKIYKEKNNNRSFNNNPYEYSYDTTYENNPHGYNYDTQSNNSTYYGEEKNENTKGYGEGRRRRSYYTQHQTDPVNEEFDYDNSDDDIEYRREDYEVNTWYTYKVWVTEKFNFIFKGIPNTYEEYETLLNRYQKKCDKCIENIILLGELIEQLTKEANFLNIERFNAISDERIEALYQRKREKLYKISLKASSELNVLYNKLCNREAMLKPKIDKEFATWLQEKDKQTTKYNELLSFYNYQRANFANTDFKKLERQINDLHNFITENYLDPRAAYIEITNDILDEDDMYQDIKEKYEEISLAFDEADLNYKNYCSTPEIHKRHIKEPIEKDYEQKLKQLRNLILNKKRRKEYFEKVLENTQKKQEHLVSTYGNEFGKDSGRKR